MSYRDHFHSNRHISLTLNLKSATLYLYNFKDRYTSVGFFFHLDFSYLSLKFVNNDVNIKTLWDYIMCPLMFMWAC